MNYINSKLINIINNKKYVCVLLTLMLLMSVMSGCGKNGDADATTSNTASDSEVTTDEVYTSDFLQVSVGTLSYNYYDYENEHSTNVTVSYPYVELVGNSAEEHPELESALQAANDHYREEMDVEVQSLMDTYQMDYDDGLSDRSYYSECDTGLLRADNQVLSLKEHWSNYYGGAHGDSIITGVAFDVITGERIKLSDIVTDGDILEDMVYERLLETYADLFEEKPLEFDGNILGENTHWSIDYTGIEIYFNTYELGFPYAFGEQTVRITFAEAPDIFNPKYCSKPDKYAYELFDYFPVYMDVDNDGEEESIRYIAYPNEWDAEVLTLFIDDEPLELENYDYSRTVSVINTGDHVYVYVFHFVENDYSVLDIIDAGSMKIISGDDDANMYLQREYDGDYETYIYTYTHRPITDPDEVVMNSSLWTLSTYSGSKTYRIGDDGIPVSDDEFYQIDNSIVLKSKWNITADEVDTEGNIVQTGVEIPKDSMLRIVRNNGSNIVDVQVADYSYEQEGEDEWVYWRTDEPVDLNRGTTYRLTISGEYNDEIDGVSIYDLFSGMMFAG